MTFGSSPRVACRLGGQLDKLAGQVGTHMVTSGCDLAPGGERSKKGHLNKRRCRIKDMIKRHRTLCKYRKALPRE
eukprot:4608722-Pyramimonas_sp.AAC.1